MNKSERKETSQCSFTSEVKNVCMKVRGTFLTGKMVEA